MKGKIAHFLLLLNSVLLHFGTGEALFTVNGIVNGSVTLPSGSPYTSPSEVQWTIDRTIIAFYLEPDIVTMDAKRFGDRLRLNTKDGSLQINRAQMGDADTYTVEVSHNEHKHNAVVKLMIYERADTPILEVLTNTSGPQFCHVSVRCTTLHGLWVESLCQLTQGKLVCQETARNDSAHSALLLITATRDAINCSSSNPASTSSAPLLPVTQVCPAPVPVLQVSSVHGTSLVLNGAVGESIVLPTDEEGPIRGPGFMEWRKNNVNVILLVSEQDNSTFTNRETNAAFKGRLIVNYETGALNISSLREEDSGEYDFTGLRSSVSLRPKTIQLHIYERIVSVQVTSQVNNSTDDSSCNVTLSCSVIGGSQVVLSWSRNGENIAGAENRATLTVSPTRAEEDYTCTAINPISSLSNTVTAGPCQTVLQVSSVHGTSLVLNGAVGESIVLPTDEEGPIRGPGFMQWLKNKVTVIRLVNKQDSSPFETRETNAAFKGRLIVNYETGALTISSLREDDSGEYVFEGIGSFASLRPKTIQLHIYERIVSVQVTSQVNNSTDGSSCHVTLSCSVIGGSQVALSWSRNGENIAGAENRATLSVSPTRAEEDYTCTAINPISSLSNTVTARPCQTGTGEALFTVNGIVNGSVTLPSGSPYTSPSEVQWRIDRTVIAFYLEPDTVTTDAKRFGDRLRLNTTGGSLQINRAQMGDADTYTVEVSQGKSKHNAEVKLMIYEQADTPILEVLTNTSGPQFCNVSVRCATLQGLWVASLCQLTQGKLVCQETARNDSAHSARLLITATRDAINCSSSNPASTSSAPLLPIKQVCPSPVPGKE